MIINDFNFIPAFKGYESDELQPKDPLSAEVLNYANNGKTIPWYLWDTQVDGEKMLLVLIYKNI